MDRVSVGGAMNLRYTFDGTKCADVAVDEKNKKAYLLFAKVECPQLPIQTEYDDLTVVLYYEDVKIGWTPFREMLFKKVKMQAIGQDEVVWNATFEYEGMTKMNRLM
jgi:hypothetical protein